MPTWYWMDTVVSTMFQRAKKTFRLVSAAMEGTTIKVYTDAPEGLITVSVR